MSFIHIDDDDLYKFSLSFSLSICLSLSKGVKAKINWFGRKKELHSSGEYIESERKKKRNLLNSHPPKHYQFIDEEKNQIVTILMFWMIIDLKLLEFVFWFFDFEFLNSENYKIKLIYAIYECL